MKALIPCFFLLASCTTMPPRIEDGRITGIVHTGCGAAEGGSVGLALDASDHFVIIHADGSWGNGGDAGWSLPSNAPDFSVQVCDEMAGNCEAATKATFVVESSSSSTMDGRISYEVSGRKREFAFRAIRTDINEPQQICG